jgi:1,4-alpha-glucan branching enzyme
MLQPYLIAILMCKGQPMLWQGEEFGENYFLPEFGAGRVALMRALGFFLRQSWPMACAIGP